MSWPALLQVHKGFLNQHESFTTKPKSGGQQGSEAAAVSGIRGVAGKQLGRCPRLAVGCWDDAQHFIFEACTWSIVPPLASSHNRCADQENITAVLLGLSGGTQPQRIVAAGHSLGAALRCVSLACQGSAARLGPGTSGGCADRCIVQDSAPGYLLVVVHL